MDTPARSSARRLRRIATALGCAALLLTLGDAPHAAAHPLGNFTVNTYAGIRITPDAVVLDFVVDLAEVATVQARPFADNDADGQVDDAEWSSYAQAGCGRWTQELSLTEAGTRLDLQAEGFEQRVQPGEGGAPTLRIECAMIADRAPSAGRRRIVLEDKTFANRVGWREITAVGDRTTLVSSTVGERTTSDRLQAYPAAGLDDPIDIRTAEVEVEPGGPVAAGEPTSDEMTPSAGFLGTGSWAVALQDMMGEGLLREGLAIVAVLGALALGLLHALAPGHGKTVMAAYLVGQRGSARHAGALALSVALTHTAGVLVLGAALWTASVAAPERFYPLLGAGSGVIIVGVGVAMLVRQRGRLGHHQHAHGQLASRPGPADGEPGPEPLQARTLVALGFAGGLVPTPSALVVLLAALSVGKVWFGVLLVACYGVGMALALVGIGMALSRARGRMDDRLQRVGSVRIHALSHALPRVMATFVTLAGAVVIVRAVL